MSTISVQAIAGRVVLVHDTPTQIIHSELDVEQANTLLEALERAKQDVLRMLA